MSAYQCWLTQKELLRESLKASGDTEGAVSLVRRTLAQVEQNVMAEQPDDLLRQQTGILFSCFKSSLSLLDITVATRVWVAQSHQEAARPKRRPASFWLLLTGTGLALGGLFAYFRGLPLIWIPLAAALCCLVVGWITIRRAPKSEAPLPEDRLKVTAKPDTEKLFEQIDAQMRAIDRYTNDFAYLNEQNALRSGSPALKNTAVLSELMESVCECEGEAGEEAVSAAERLLGDIGARAVWYAPEQARLFNVLPSISETRTLTPALVSLKDGALLYRGTAAVLAQAAGSESPAPAQPARSDADAERT
jgi:hypothetical protein